MIEAEEVEGGGVDVGDVVAVFQGVANIWHVRERTAHPLDGCRPTDLSSRDRSGSKLKFCSRAEEADVELGEEIELPKDQRNIRHLGPSERQKHW